MITYVFLAGIDNSSPEHWQRYFQYKLGRTVWVEHADWAEPDATEWVAEMDAALRDVKGSVVFVAHSLGCLLLTEWLKAHPGRAFAGAVLVAPPDPANPAFPHALVSGFGPGDSVKLGFPGLVLASQDDPYGSMDYVKRCAKHWDAPLIDMGAKGHLNAASGLADWPEGWGALHAFLQHHGIA